MFSHPLLAGEKGDEKYLSLLHFEHFKSLANLQNDIPSICTKDLCAHASSNLYVNFLPQTSDYF